MSSQVYIRGIVGLARRVRQELAGGVTPVRLERLRQAVREALEVTDRTLSSAGLGLEALPTPTRMAYRFLAGLDFGRIQAVSASSSHETPPGTVHFPGLRAWLDGVLTRLSLAQDEEGKRRVYDSVRSTHASLEQQARKTATRPEQLKAGARALCGWLAYFAREENFGAYLQALACAKAAFDEAQARQGRFPAPVVVHFRPMKGVYRVRGLADGTLVHLPTPMISFDEGLLRLLAAVIFLGQGSKQPIVRAMAHPGYKAILAQVEPPCHGGQQAIGLHHSLEEAFARVNEAYFGGTMPRPALQWSSTFTVRKFGHCDRLRDAVMVSASLDSPDVPAHVVDFIVYHELLHRKLGAQWNGNRQAIHTPEFLAEENRFAKHAEAKAFLDRFAKAGRSG